MAKVGVQLLASMLMSFPRCSGFAAWELRATGSSLRRTVRLARSRLDRSPSSSLRPTSAPLSPLSHAKWHRRPWPATRG
ncbi:hypothetical protein F5Y09DRAFT_295968 [Xylaria sp. FL1042]|nr:hypothetical protein F5Y09DRAFT_295968 [Xylaria sp. FL1042]